MSDTVSPERSAAPSGKKKSRAGLVFVLAVLLLLVLAAAALLLTGSMDRMIATSKAGRGDYAGALDSYEKYLSRSGDESTEAYTQAALYALSAGDADKALMYARSVPVKTEESERLEEKAALVMARKAVANKDWQTALPLLEGIDGEDAKEARKLIDEVNCNLAAEAAERQEFEKAIELLEDNSCALSEDLLAEYRYRYGVALMEEGRYDEAIAQFDQTDYADSDDLRGQCYYMNSADRSFLEELKKICLDIIGENASPESLKRAEAILAEYADMLFHDSELAFFGEELRNAILGELGAAEDDIPEFRAMENEALEIINELYPFAEDVWEQIASFFGSGEPD